MSCEAVSRLWTPVGADAYACWVSQSMSGVDSRQ